MSLRDPSPELWRRMQAMNTTDAHAVAREYPDALPGEQPPGAPEKKGRNGRTAAQESAAQSKRAKTGAKFEAELDETHEWLRAQSFGYIMLHYPPTIKIGSANGVRIVYRKGGGPCDYSGHVNIRSARRRVDWKLERADVADVVRLPVVFDAKTLTAGRASYTHSAEQIAQVKYLENAHGGGALAFLLVRCDTLGRVFGVSYANHADELLRSKPIRLYETVKGERFPLLPSIGFTPGKGWLWPEMLPWLSD